MFTGRTALSSGLPRNMPATAPKSSGRSLAYSVIPPQRWSASSSLETATRRAVVINEADSGGYGLLLDPETPTATRIDGGDGGALTLNVVTQEVAWQLSRRGRGFITLAYTLLIGAQPLSALQVELTLTKEEN